MTKRTRATFTTEFKLDCAQLVLDQGYTTRQAAESMNVGKSTIDKWVRQLKKERNGVADQPNALTVDQRKIKELEKKVKRIEMEKDILKKATALLMSDSLNNLR